MTRDRSRPLLQVSLVPIVVVLFSIALIAVVLAVVFSSPRVTAILEQLEPPSAEAR